MQLIITNKGKELITKMLDGTSTATFTRVCTSDFNYSEENIEGLEQLQGIKQEAPIAKVSGMDSSTVEIFVAINNSKLTESYYVRTLGLYAKDSQNREILYGVSIGGESPDYMPAFTGKTVTGISYTIRTKVDNSSQVTVEVNPAATPTIGQVEQIERSIREHANLKVYSGDGVHGLRFHNSTLQFASAGMWNDLDANYIPVMDSCGLSPGGEGTPWNMQDLVDKIAEKVMYQLIDKNKIVNNLLATDPTTVLSGAMGRELKGMIPEIDSINGIIKFNTLSVKFGVVNIVQGVFEKTSETIDFSTHFASIKSAICMAQTSVPKDKTSSLIVSGTAVTFYLHNNTNNTGLISVSYQIIGVPK